MGVGSSFFSKGFACGRCVKVQCDDKLCAQPGASLVAMAVDLCGAWVGGRRLGSGAGLGMCQLEMGRLVEQRGRAWQNLNGRPGWLGRRLGGPGRARCATDHDSRFIHRRRLHPAAGDCVDADLALALPAYANLTGQEPGLNPRVAVRLPPGWR